MKKNSSNIVKKTLVNIWYNTFGYLINNMIFTLNYSIRYRQYEYIYQMLAEEMKSDPDVYNPQYDKLRLIIGTGGSELFGCRGVSDVVAARNYERVFRKYCILCSYNSDISKIYEHFKDEYV